MVRRTLHLVRRFFGSLRPGGPRAAEVDHIRAVLSPAEFEVWSSMSGPDRRHSAVVLREVERAMGEDMAPPISAAALLHDSGKVASGLRTPMRVVATVCAATVVRSNDVAVRWSRRRGPVGRIGTYLRHPELGAARLQSIGSDPLTIAWTAEHHRAIERVTIDRRIADALRAADDD